MFRKRFQNVYKTFAKCIKNVSEMFKMFRKRLKEKKNVSEVVKKCF